MPPVEKGPQKRSPASDGRFRVCISHVVSSVSFVFLSLVSGRCPALKCSYVVYEMVESEELHWSSEFIHIMNIAILCLPHISFRCFTGLHAGVST